MSITADMLLMELTRQSKDLDGLGLTLEWGGSLSDVEVHGAVDLEALAEAINREAGK